MSEQLLALIAFAFVSSITPGPNNLMLMASGANFGVVRTLPHALGVALGFCIMLITLGLGLMAAFERYPLVHEVLKISCAAYLCYLAWKIANAAPLDATASETATGARPFTFLQAAAFQWVNPKAWTMGMAALSLFAMPSQPLNGLLLIALVFLIVNFPSIMAWTTMGMQMRRFLNNSLRLRIFNIVAGLLLLTTLVPIFLH